MSILRATAAALSLLVAMALVAPSAVASSDDVGAPSVPPCPEIADAFSLATGDIRLSWSPVEGADGYRFYRAVEGGAFSLLEASPFPAIDDEDAEIGVTYEYRATAVVGGLESTGCDTVAVTSIPFFGSALLGGLALAGAAGSLFVLRRR